MKLLATIREKDIDPKNEQLPDEAHIKHRQSAKVVLFDGEGNIALNYYPPRESGDYLIGYYLPGGGIDEGEDILTGLRREAMEETGCAITDIKEIGYTIEYMRQNTLRQEAFAFMAKVLGEKGKPELTEKEAGRGMQVVWKPIDEAAALIGQNTLKDFGGARSLIILAAVGEMGGRNKP